MLTLLALLACSTEAVLGTPVTPQIERVPPQVGPQALQDATHATGSNTVVVVDGKVFALHPDSGEVSRLDPATSTVDTVDLGAEPTRIAAAGDALYVTLHGQRELVKLSASRFDGIDARVTLGAEPHGVVVREDGERVYVAVAQQDEVVELDDDLNELTRFQVVGEPRYLALHPSGVRLFVGLTRGQAGAVAVDLVDGAVSPISLPETTREGSVLGARISGDLAVSPDGTKLVVPVLYLDTATPIPAMSSVEEIGQEPVFPPEGGSPYGAGFDQVGRTNPAVVEVQVSATGEAGSGRALFVSVAGMDTDLFLPVMTFRSMASAIDGVTVSPEGDRYLVTMGSAGTVALLAPAFEVFGSNVPILDSSPVDGPMQDSDGDGLPDSEGDVFFGSSPLDNGFDIPAAVAMDVGVGASGAAFVGEDIVANDGFTGTLQHFERPFVEQLIDEATMMSMNPAQLVVASNTRVISPSPLSAELQLGRELFHSSRNPSMGAGGVACVSCHVRGRTDGITWSFTDGPRQTPSLAGRVSETAPVTWRSGVGSVREEVEITTLGRMGGIGLGETELDAIAAFVDWTRLPDTPRQGVVDGAAVRGRQVFEDAGCAACHQGDVGTDGQSWSIRGVSDLNTPALRGIAASAPYLHDGSAPDLRAVLELGEDGTMGMTQGLTEGDKDDLVEYLLTL